MKIPERCPKCGCGTITAMGDGVVTRTYSYGKVTDQEVEPDGNWDFECSDCGYYFDDEWEIA